MILRVPLYSFRIRPGTPKKGKDNIPGIRRFVSFSFLGVRPSLKTYGNYYSRYSVIFHQKDRMDFFNEEQSRKLSTYRSSLVMEVLQFEKLSYATAVNSAK